MDNKIDIDGEEYEVLPVTLSSTVPDDDDNIQYLLETLVRRIRKRDAIKIERELTAFGEVNRYTVLVLKEVNRVG